MLEFCAHRRVSLWYGRNEECGLRCVYHGWKFDVSGACVETEFVFDQKKVRAVFDEQIDQLLYRQFFRYPENGFGELTD